MELRTFGRTNMKLYPIGIGTYGHGTAYGEMSPEDSYEVLSKTFDAFRSKGPTFVDTAPLYGSGMCETVIGEILRNSCFPNNTLLATKAGRDITATNFNKKNFSRDFILRDIQQSLQRLNVDRVFLLQLHNPTFEEIKKHDLFQLLEQVRAEGLISYYGVSIDDPQEGVEIVEFSYKHGFDGMASIQLIYNCLNKQSLQHLLSVATQHNIAIIAREPLMRGFLTDKWYKLNSFKTMANVEARKKIVDLYSEEQIINKTDAVFSLIRKYGKNTDPARIAVEFALKNEAIKVTIPGFSKSEYIKSFTDFAGSSLTDELYAEMLCIEDVIQNDKK